VSNCK